MVNQVAGVFVCTSVSVGLGNMQAHFLPDIPQMGNVVGFFMGALLSMHWGLFPTPAWLRKWVAAVRRWVLQRAPTVWPLGLRAGQAEAEQAPCPFWALIAQLLRGWLD